MSSLFWGVQQPSLLRGLRLSPLPTSARSPGLTWVTRRLALCSACVTKSRTCAPCALRAGARAKGVGPPGAGGSLPEARAGPLQHPAWHAPGCPPPQPPAPVLPSVALPCAQSKGLSHRSSILAATISKATGDSPGDLSPALSLHCHFPPEHSAGSQSILFCSHISQATREQRALLCLKQGRDQNTVFLAPALAVFWCLPRTAGARREGTHGRSQVTL